MNCTFDYIAPGSLAEAARLLQEADSSLLAGGTDLLILTRSGKLKPRLVVDIKKIDGLRSVTSQGEKLHIGALVTIQDIKENETIRRHYPALWQATPRFACYEIRLRATLGGNIAHASPGADTALPLAIYEANVEIFGTQGSRSVPLSKFITGPGKSVLQRGEIVTGFTLPACPANSRSTYLRIGRVEGMDLAVCNLALMKVPDDGNGKPQFRVAVGAVAPVPWRAEPVEKFLAGKDITEATIAEAQQILLQHIAPRESSIRGTPAYKKHVIADMLARAFSEVCNSPR